MEADQSVGFLLGQYEILAGRAQFRFLSLHAEATPLTDLRFLGIGHADQGTIPAQEPILKASLWR
jgi:hypothetical protein